MKPHEADKITRSLQGVIDVVKSLAGEKDESMHHASRHVIDMAQPGGLRPAEPKNGNIPSLDADQIEKLYRLFKSRFIDDAKTDPVLLKLIAAQPEIVLEFEPRIVTLDTTTLRGRVGRLIHDGFFDGGKRQGECRAELARTGSDPNSGQLSTLFSEFLRDGFIEKTAGDRYVKAPGLKVSTRQVETTR